MLLAGLRSLAADRSGRLAQRFYLRRGLNTAVGDDLLQYPEARFYSLHMGRILRGLFSRLIGDELTHLFFVLKPSIEYGHAETAQAWNRHYNHEEDQQ